MIKQAIYTFGGANQDTSRGKHNPQFYYEAQHLNLLSTDTQATGGASNEKGNSLTINIPDITIGSNGVISYNTSTLNFTSSELLDLAPLTSTEQVIIGHATTRDSIVLFTTDNSIDCIWELEGVLTGEYNLVLKYTRQLGFSTSNPIQTVFNYENENIQKIYWVDGVHQIRAINLVAEDLINTPQNNLDFVGEVSFSQPVIAGEVGGGTHTAGMIQYAYNLFRLNSSQTKLSPISELYALDKGDDLGGGEVNEIVGVTPIVEINDIDTDYEYIRVYAIKYTSLDVTPSISLIEEREIGGDNSIRVYDDGSVIEELSVEELLFLGSDPIIPQHIVSKDNILFPSNIQDAAFDMPDDFDARAYSFDSNNICRVEDEAGNSIPVSNTTFEVPDKHPAINPDYDRYNRQAGGLGAFFGGEGKYIEYRLFNTTPTNLSIDQKDGKFFKDREIYRLGIVFFNQLGQDSSPLWIADLKSIGKNLEDLHAVLTVTLKPSFYTWLDAYKLQSGVTENDIPVGYKIVRANRTTADKTILTQGIIGGMMVNNLSSDPSDISEAQRRPISDSTPKIPNFLIRTQQNISPLQPNKHLLRMQFADNNPNTTGDASGSTRNPLTEIAYDRGARRVQSYQYTTMMQLFSPEILFNNVVPSSGLKLRIPGGAKNTANKARHKSIRVSNQEVDAEVLIEGGVTHQASGTTVVSKTGLADNTIMPRGLICNGGDNRDEDSVDRMQFMQWYREFTDYQPANDILEYEIYGKPEITERGQGIKSYNNDNTLRYSNRLEIATDGDDDFNGTVAGIVTSNSWGTKCATIVLDNQQKSSWTRTSIEQMHANAGLSVSHSDTALIGELLTQNTNIYGGNSYEDKQRTEYISIGSYAPIEQTSITIESPGDTFVQDYQFLRVAKTDTEVFDTLQVQMTEIINVKLETSIDVKNRNDQSIFDWDTNFQPRYDEYVAYNSVYSQQPTLIKRTGEEVTFQRVKNFDTRIQASKVKIPNELVDSWTDLLVNETMDLDGKYGPLNNVVSFRDNLYAFQDEGIAAITVNPRVQVQGSDGVAIELGTGGILYDYNYISDKSGSRNKWSIQPTKRGIYYYDVLNKAVGRVPDMTSLLLTDTKGLHTFFNNNHNFDLIVKDNPVLGTGALIGYDNYNNDVFISLLQGDQSFTWRYDEESDTFTDLKTYVPSRYIYKGEKLFYPSVNNNDLWEQYGGEYNSFFGEYKPTYITLLLNPAVNMECIFDNIEFNSELYLDDVDQPDKTLTHIQAYNEYQDSGRIPLIVGRNSNLRRKFRKWRANIPRTGRNRMRNPWIFLKLELDNESNYKMILHDVIVSYTV